MGGGGKKNKQKKPHKMHTVRAVQESRSMCVLQNPSSLLFIKSQDQSTYKSRCNQISSAILHRQGRK